MNLANLFRIPNPNPAPNPNPQNSNPNPTPTLSGESSPQLDAANKAQEQGGKEGQVQNPLDPFADLWEAPKVDDASGNNNPDKSKTQNQPVDFAGAAKKINFGRIIPPDLATKALGGDQAAFTQILNTVGQAGFAAAGKMSEGMIAKAIADAEQRIGDSLSGKFKEFSVSNTRSKNPNLQHKAVKPMVEAIKSQMNVKFPDATAEEIQEKAEAYVGAMLQAYGSGTGTGTDEDEVDPTKARQKSQAAGTFDWDKEFGLTS